MKTISNCLKLSIVSLIAVATFSAVGQEAKTDEPNPDGSQFLPYAKSHPGMQHKAGVPVAGTFIMVVDGSTNKVSSVATNSQSNDLFEVGVGYNFMRTEGEDIKYLNGVQLSGFYNVNSWLALGGEFSRLVGADTRHYYMVNEDISLDRYLYLFGPQITVQPLEKVKVVAHVLAGGVHDENSTSYPGGSSHSSANAFALTVGGGVDVQVTKRITVGPMFDYTPTAFSASSGNNWQNNWRVGVVGKISF